MFHRILIAVDSSTPALAATRAAADLAAQSGAAVALCHVVHPIVSLGPAYLPDAYEDAAVLAARGRRLLADLHHAFDASTLPVEDHLLEGRPADAIVADAANWHADLIVVGDRARPALSRFLIGSTTDAVVRRAPCPVLVVREPHTHAHATPPHPAHTDTTTSPPPPDNHPHV